MPVRPEQPILRTPGFRNRPVYGRGMSHDVYKSAPGWASRQKPPGPESFFESTSGTVILWVPAVKLALPTATPDLLSPSDDVDTADVMAVPPQTTTETVFDAIAEVRAPQAVV